MVKPRMYKVPVICHACGKKFMTINMSHKQDQTIIQGEKGLCPQCDKDARSGLLFRCVDCGMHGLIRRGEGTVGIINHIRKELGAPIGEIAGMDVKHEFHTIEGE